MRWRHVTAATACLMMLAAVESSTSAADAKRWGLTPGSAALTSAGPLAFGPDGVLLVGDPMAATVLAIATDDAKSEQRAPISLVGINQSIQQELQASEVTVQDLAVHPLSGSVYLSVSAKTSAGTKPALVRVTADGKVKQVSLDKVDMATVTLPDAPDDQPSSAGSRRGNPRMESITDIAYADGRVLISGVSKAQTPSTVWEVMFPLQGADAGTPVEIYHGAHGRYEDNAVVRTFIPITIDGQPSILAGFTCTPLVRFSLSDLQGTEKVRGTTVAELGNRNRPLDMFQYEKDGESYLLMANSARGVMKVSLQDVQRGEGITAPVRGGGTAGQPYESIAAWEGVVQLDRYDPQHAVLLVQHQDGRHDLKTVALP